MQTSAFRVEVIRFSLLVMLTVGLLSVAIRLASHPDAHSTAQPGRNGHGHPQATATGTTTNPGGTASSAPATTAPTSTPTTAPSPASTGAGAGNGGNSGGNTGGSAGGNTGGSSGGASTQPVLPVTGYDAALRLGALSLVLIGAGTFTIRASRR